jgi:hypothetical protein
MIRKEFLWIETSELSSNHFRWNTLRTSEMGFRVLTRELWFKMFNWPSSSKHFFKRNFGQLFWRRLREELLFGLRQCVVRCKHHILDTTLLWCHLVWEVWLQSQKESCQSGKICLSSGLSSLTLSCTFYTCWGRNFWGHQTEAQYSRRNV